MHFAKKLHLHTILFLEVPTCFAEQFSWSLQYVERSENDRVSVVGMLDISLPSLSILTEYYRGENGMPNAQQKSKAHEKALNRKNDCKKTQNCARNAFLYFLEY